MMGTESATQAGTAVVRLNLAVLGGGFAWFAYIDAPITDGAMLMFALAVFAGLLSVAAALHGAEAGWLAAEGSVQPGDDPAAGRAAARRRRRALILFLASLTLMLASATFTLNLKGTGDDSQDTQTAAV